MGAKVSRPRRKQKETQNEQDISLIDTYFYIFEGAGPHVVKAEGWDLSEYRRVIERLRSHAGFRPLQYQLPA